MGLISSVSMDPDQVVDRYESSLASFNQDQNKLELLNSRVNVNEIYQREHLTNHRDT